MPLGPGGWDVGAALHSAWIDVLAVLVPLLFVAVLALVVMASRKDASEQSEWQEWLHGRSITHRDR
jgi:hypothetical protein